ncbi:MAG: hypothetical protein HKN49_06625, partial [Gammaproteobacteria bacterium]|nr:hypothetical protein [Gammaproteobacteria bacterium]
MKLLRALLAPALVLSQISTPAIAETVELDAASVAALVELLPPTGEEFGLRFAPTTPQLLALQVGDVIVIPQTPILPTGHMGPVLSRTDNPGEIILTTESDRFAGAVDPADIGANFTFTVTPPVEGDPEHTCEISEEGYDSDGDQTNDAGMATGNCSAGNGGDHAFRMTLVDGVEINGVLTIAPFDIDATIFFEQFELQSLSISSTSRISFTGEISAEFDYDLPEDPLFMGEFPVANFQLNIAQVGTVNIAIDAEVFVGTTGFIRAGAKAGLSTTAEVLYGIEWDGEGPPSTFAQQGQADIQISPPELTDDTEADLTLYGGAKLKLETDVTYGGFLPVAGTNVIVTAKGDVNLHVLPIADPWWEISGTPNLYVDVVPQLLFANLAEYSFVIIEPEPEIFFTSQNEFPFSTQPVRSAGGNVAGDALRWSRAYYEPEIRTNDVAPTSDGGAIAVGDDLQFGVILKTDFQGNREWQRRLEGDYKPLTIRQLADGGYVLGGKVGTKLWLARFDATGGLVWSKEYAFDEGQPQDLFLYPVAGGVLVGGEFLTAAPELDFAPYAMQIGLDGTPGWAWLYGQAELDEEVLGFTGTADGGLMLVGETDFTPVGPVIAGQNAYTLRLLPDGTVYWSQVWASANVDRLYAAAQAPDGSYLVGGVSNGTTLDQSTRGLLIRYPADDKQPPENARWLTAIGGNVDISQSWWDEIRSIVPTRGGFTIAGHTLLGEERKAWLAKVTEQNDDPDLIWSAFHDGGA